MTPATQPARKRWFDDMTPDEHARWFKYTSPERTVAYADDLSRRYGFPRKCEDPAIIALVVEMVMAARASQPGDLAEAA